MLINTNDNLGRLIHISNEAASFIRKFGEIEKWCSFRLLGVMLGLYNDIGLCGMCILRLFNFSADWSVNTYA